MPCFEIGAYLVRFVSVINCDNAKWVTDCDLPEGEGGLG